VAVFSNGRKFDPPALTAPQRDALTRATCAAAEYRLVTGEGELIGAEDGIASVAGVVTFSRNPVPRVAPKLLEELAGAGLFLASGTLPVEDD
jgi:hypothetical protein